MQGQARLEIAVEGEILSIRLDSPLDNLLGFEQAPRNERERQAVRRMTTHLNDSATQFQPSRRMHAARQLARSARARQGFPRTMGRYHGNPRWQGEASSAAKNTKPRAHADEKHGELTATSRFRCAPPRLLRDLKVKLFAAFPGLRRIDVVAITEKGQSAARLSASQPQLRW